jgi:hypothetical protein
MEKSSYIINQSKIKWEEDRTSCLPIIKDSTASAKPFFMLMESNTNEEAPAILEREKTKPEERTKFAGDTIVQKDAVSAKENATSNIAVSNVEREAMKNPTAKLNQTKDHKHGMNPKYLRHNLWDPITNATSCTSDWSETALPLVRPPPKEFRNEPVL